MNLRWNRAVEFTGFGIGFGIGRRNVDCVVGVVYGVRLKSDSRIDRFGGLKMSIPKEPEQVMKQRDGYVLGKKTILKSDHFPGCHNKRLYPHIDGAPNYRQVLLLFSSITCSVYFAELNVVTCF